MLQLLQQADPLVLGVVTLAALLALLLLFRIIRQARTQRMRTGLAQPRGDSQSRMVLADFAGAVVVSVNPGRPANGAPGRRQVELLLDVRPTKGEPYQAKTDWLVDASTLTRLQPGSAISVKIDSENPQIIYPNIMGARILLN